MSEELKQGYLHIADSLGVAIRELEMKASILKNIQVALWHQANDSTNPDMVHNVNPENLFEIIRNSIKTYEKHK